MTPKERAAMQQALEALENERSHMTANWDNIVQAITALREALAEPDMNLSCKSVQARLATSWGYVKAEQAEQEPVAWMVYTADGQSVYVTDNPTDIKVGQRALPLYTAPVRTKDLTDDEIESIVDGVGAYEVGYWHYAFARAVIQEFRRKNK